jgi:hypothetical protein
MSAKSPEGRRILRELEKELAAASVRQGQNVVWSAQESAILGQISSILDRKWEFLSAVKLSRAFRRRCASLSAARRARKPARSAGSLLSDTIGVFLSVGADAISRQGLRPNAGPCLYYNPSRAVESAWNTYVFARVLL